MRHWKPASNIQIDAHSKVTLSSLPSGAQYPRDTGHPQKLSRYLGQEAGVCFSSGLKGTETFFWG